MGVTQYTLLTPRAISPFRIESNRVESSRIPGARVPREQQQRDKKKKKGDLRIWDWAVVIKGIAHGGGGCTYGRFDALVSTL